MNYGDLIRDAFRITLHNRYLWFFGFFAGGVSFPTGPGNFNPQAGQGVLPFQVQRNDLLAYFRPTRARSCVEDLSIPYRNDGIYPGRPARAIDESDVL